MAGIEVEGMGIELCCYMQAGLQRCEDTCVEAAVLAQQGALTGVLGCLLPALQ
jgi:hypothetical protein